MPWKKYYFIGVLLGCAGLLGFGYFLENRLNLAPCPLCVLQRGAMGLLLLIGLAGALHRPARLGTCLYTGLAALVAAAGAAVAAWQLHMQHLPESEKVACGPGWDYLMETFPLSEALRRIFTASGECSEVQWTFLGLSIPGWSLLWLACCCIVSVWVLVRAWRLPVWREFP